MNKFITIICLTIGWINAFPTVPGLSSPNSTHGRTKEFFDELTILTQEKQFDDVYAVLSSVLRRKVDEADFIKGLNKDWIIIEILVLNVEEYSDYSVAVIRLDQSGSLSKKSRSIIPVFLKEEDGELKLLHFPFSLTGAPGIILREPVLNSSEKE